MTNITAIRFYYNGIRFNGSKQLEKVRYYFAENDYNSAVRVMADRLRFGEEFSSLFKEIHSDSDPYADYWDSDDVTIAPDHPLYKYAQAATLKLMIRDQSRHIAYVKKHNCIGYNLSDLESRLADLESYLAAHPVGNPTIDDINATVEYYDKIKAAKIAAAKAEEEQEQKAYHEAFLKEKKETSEILKKIVKRYPLDPNGQNYVEFLWSECPAFYGLCDDQKNLVYKVSIKAADLIIKELDSYYKNQHRGYQKTKLRIHLNDQSYAFRYDIGCDSGSISAHIRDYASQLLANIGVAVGFSTEDNQKEGTEVMEFVAALDEYLNGFDKSLEILEKDFQNVCRISNIVKDFADSLESGKSYEEISEYILDGNLDEFSEFLQDNRETYLDSDPGSNEQYHYSEFIGCIRELNLIRKDYRDHLLISMFNSDGSANPALLS